MIPVVDMTSATSYNRMAPPICSFQTMRVILPFIVLCSVAFANTVISAETGTNKPNIVILLADDLGWADVSWHGKEIRTPQLDKLVAQGMRLEQFYVQPVCTPTRAALMTGRYPMRYGLQGPPMKFWSDYGLATDERTIAEALQEVGYFTAICGKWHLGHMEKKYLPNQRGFDHQYGHYIGMIHYYTHMHGGGSDWNRNGKPITEEGYSTDLIADESIRLIQNHDTKKPLFLYVPFNAVHGPYQPSPYEEMNAQYSSLKGNRKIYAGMVAAMDLAIGRILDALEEKNIKDNTIIFFCSDNGGPLPGEVTDNGPLRGSKGTLFEGGVRVPAVIAWQGKIKPGSVSEQPMHIADLYPTLLGIAGVSLKQQHPIDGLDMKATLLENAPIRDREILHNTTPEGGALRIGSWKMIVNERTGVELFDIVADPNEKNDLSAAHPEKVAELMKRYRTLASQAEPILFKSQPPDFKSPPVWGDFD